MHAGTHMRWPGRMSHYMQLVEGAYCIPASYYLSRYGTAAATVPLQNTLRQVLSQLNLFIVASCFYGLCGAHESHIMWLGDA